MAREMGSGARDARMDYAKAIGIVLVVYGHVARGLMNAGMAPDSLWMEALDRSIYSFHMPLFFFLSGMSFSGSLARHGARSLLLGKVDTVLYPYVVWSLVQGLAEAGLARFTNNHLPIYEVLALAWNPRAQFWFLYALMPIFLLATLVREFARGVRPWLLAATFGLLYMVAGPLGSLWRVLELVAYGGLYFALGVVFDGHRDRLWRLLRAAVLPLGLLFLAVQTLLPEPRYEQGGLAALEAAVVATLSIGFVLAVTTWIARPGPRWLETLGRQSMPIYLMHVLAASGARIVLSRVFGVHDLAVQLGVGVAVGVGVPLALQALFIERWAPFLMVPPAALSVARFGRRAAPAATAPSERRA